MNSCCAPSSGRGEHVGAPDVARSTVQHASTPFTGEVVALAATTFWMGSPPSDGYPSDGEGPEHRVTVAPFAIGSTTVTIEEFAQFADATGHVTLAEADGWSFVFGGLLPDDFPPTRSVAAAPWWRQVEGADWRHPFGPQSGLEGLGQHPVVHVTWDDALAYCAWSGTRLPTEAEWEFAARGGLDRKRFPWGDELEPDGVHLMNVFQGDFPATNTLRDGYGGTAPVRSFPPNGFGLYETTGNVWEWCSDWFDPATYRPTPRTNPTGPPTGTHRVMRGGSYLCHHSYCTRYRVGARSANTPDSSAGNIGFRVVTVTT